MSLRSLPLSARVALALAALSAAPGLALAQDDPELGETGSDAAEQDQDKEDKKATSPNTWGVAGSASTSGTETSSEWGSSEAGGGSAKRVSSSGESDHESVVGSLGIGLLGLAEVPVGTAPGSARTVDSTVTAPVLGARYWLSERFGLEAGVGFMFRSGSVEDSAGNKGDLSSRAFVLHGGLPIALFWGEHFNFLAIPYLGLGFSKATDGRGQAASADDVFGKGFLFEAGLRAGVEVQLGAIGLEGFALQLTGGVRLRFEKTHANIPLLDDDDATPASYDVDGKQVVFATSPGSTLGSSIAGSLAAVYYF
jgi:hypothetical protein